MEVSNMGPKLGMEWPKWTKTTRIELGFVCVSVCACVRGGRGGAFHSIRGQFQNALAGIDRNGIPFHPRPIPERFGRNWLEWNGKMAQCIKLPSIMERNEIAKVKRVRHRWAIFSPPFHLLLSLHLPSPFYNPFSSSFLLHHLPKN